MGFDLRIVFLLLLAVTAFLLIMRRGAFVSVGNIFEILLDFFLVLAVSATVIIFGFLLTGKDPVPLLRNLGYMISLNQVVSFDHAIPPNLQDNLAVSDIVKIDTDGDSYKEWVVFYNFDLRGDDSPVQGFIYDNDRGNPPVIFPYALLPPNRNYLSQAKVSAIEMEDVAVEKNGPNGENLQEVLVKGTGELSIFSFKQNSAEWDYPRDAPPRYQPVGFFQGNGGVDFNSETKNVTVRDGSGFERSQLVNRSVYALNKSTNTYWDKYYDPSELGRKLAAPIVSTIDFPGESPGNILSTTYPENIVLAFYGATCGSTDLTLCRHADVGWKAKSFLDPNGGAYAEFQNNNAAYFELPNLKGTRNISAKFLQYYPQLETDADLLTSGGGRDIVTGEQAQANVVDITFALGDSNGGTQEKNVRYKMTLVDGQWKISGRLESPDLPSLGDPKTLGE